MNTEQILAVALIVAMMAAFIWGRFRYDLVAATALLAGMFLGLVPYEKAFSGFSDEIVIIVGSALLVSSAVARSGVIEAALHRFAPSLSGVRTQLFLLVTVVAVASAFVKNIGALAIFLPVALRISKRTGTSVSALLMPMAFGSLIGGLVTLIGTSPNILVSRVRDEVLGKPFAMFDFAPVGLGILAVGLTFLAFGWRLLPIGRGAQASTEEAFKIESYVIEATVPPTSRFVDKTVAKLEGLSGGAVSVIAIIRERGRRYIPAGHWWIFADDVLVLQGDAHAVRELAEEAGLKIAGTEKIAGDTVSPAELSVVEAVVMERSPLVGYTPAELQLRDRFGINLVGISRPGEPALTRLRRTRFRSGDVIILQGSNEGTLGALRDLGCLPLVDRGTGFGSPRSEYLPLIILAATIAAIATNLISVTAAFFIAAVLLVATRVLTLKEAYEAIDPSILILLACLIPVSDAITSTGAGDLIASGLSVVAGVLPASGALALVLVAAMAITPFLNNAATVLIMAPIAASIAQTLGLNPDPFLMAVAIGAACDFLTPFGHQCNTLVMGPGGYRFGDYARLGLPLSFIVLLTAVPLIAFFWPV